MMDLNTGVPAQPLPPSSFFSTLSRRLAHSQEKVLPEAHRLSHEFDLLLACVACDNGVKANRIRDLVDGGLNWQTFLGVTEHHRLIPQVYSALGEVASLVPAAVLDNLRCRYQANARQTLRLTRDLIRVLHHFESHAIPVLAYKGPALASILHGDFAQRQFADIDLLIHASDVKRSKAALSGLGYTSQSSLTERQEESYLQSGYELAFDLPGARNVLELKWRILPRFYSIDFDVVEFFDRSVTLQLGGISVQTLSPEDSFLVLCVHAAKHAWSELSLLLDISCLIQSQPMNWDRVRERATRSGVCRILDINLVLAQNLLGVILPPSARQPESATATMDAVRRIFSAMAESQQPDTESVPYFRLMLNLRERLLDRFRFLWRLVLTPNVGEWDAVRLPSWLSPLYHMVRLYRLSVRLIKHLWLRPRLAPRFADYQKTSESKPPRAIAKV